MDIDCCICFGKQWLTITPCKHTLCLECLIQLRSDECPLCRSKIISKLPDKVKSFFKLIDNTRLNIFDSDEFPALGDHPFS